MFSATHPRRAQTLPPTRPPPPASPTNPFLRKDSYNNTLSTTPNSDSRLSRRGSMKRGSTGPRRTRDCRPPRGPPTRPWDRPGRARRWPVPLPSPNFRTTITTTPPPCGQIIKTAMQLVSTAGAGATAWTTQTLLSSNSSNSSNIVNSIHRWRGAETRTTRCYNLTRTATWERRLTCDN